MTNPLNRPAKPRRPAISTFTPKIIRRANGTASIRRETYSYKDGMVQNNSWWETRAAIIKRDGGLCVYHKRRGFLIKATEVHHIVPLSKGGTNAPANLVSVCEECHAARHHHMKRGGSHGRG